MARTRTLHEYNISTLNKWFAALSILMVVVVVGMVMDDYNRSWKQHQREFMRLDREQLAAAKAAAEENINADRLKTAQERLDEKATELAARQSQLDSLNARLTRAKGDVYERDRDFRFYKAKYDVVKYEFYAAEAEHDEAKAESTRSELAAMEAELERRRLAREGALAQQAELEAQIGELESDMTKAKARVDEFTAEIKDLDEKLAASAPSLFNTLRDAPMMEFVAPSLKINQIRPAGLSYSVNYGVTERVDRCTTCHLGIDQAKWEGAAQPYTTHPKMDLYLGAASPHPMSEFGCTECHFGRPRGVEFTRAAHTPSDDAEAERWHDEYGWKKMHHWDWPMHSSDHAEAGCMKCHQGMRLIPGADRYNAGRELVEQMGCYGCHKIAGYEGLPKPGPNLKRVADKLTPEFVYQWVNDPKAIRAHSRMPRLFNLENVVGGEEGDADYWAKRTRADVNGIVAYLFDKSERTDFGSERVPAGDASDGQALFDAIGCRACHLVGSEEDSLDVLGVSPLQFGPNLESVATKTTPEFIYAWIRDPRSYDPTTAMPNLRLTVREAADITAYLMTLRGPESEYVRGPSDPAMVETALMEYLSNTQPIERAREELEKLDPTQREVLLGEKVIARQGCFGCHLISGFEETLPIGTELTEEGSKTLHKFDFGNVHDIEHTVVGWLSHKLRHPRSFDIGMHQVPLEKARMPDFGLTDEQVSLLVGNILAWQKHTVPKDRQKLLDARETDVAKGERLIAERNCRGCHTIDGFGGAIAQYIEETGYAPPNLANEGAKVQPEWLVRFLHEPTAIRPWLSVRMPTFEFTETELGTISKYFMAAAHAQDRPYPQVDLASYPQARLGSEHFTTYKCQQCHPTGANTGGVSASELAPNLSMAPRRLRPDWIIAWLTDPQAQMPGTNMPSFFYSDGEYFFDEAPQHIEALRDYLMQLR